MAYSIIQPPFTLQFREMSKPDLQAYFDWFLNQIPVRLPIFESFIQETSGFGSWSTDFTVDSLKMLGAWYADQVETRSRSQDELDEIKQKLSFPIPVSEQELTN